MVCLLLGTLGALAFLLYKVCDWLIRLPLLGDLGKKHILITGCDSGFGHGAAIRLDRMGCHVFAGCLTEKGEVELKKKCSDRLIAFRMDVSKTEMVKKAVDLVKEALPQGKGLWAVVNNAGIAGDGNSPMEWLELEDYKNVANVNLWGLIDVTKQFLPLIKRERGRVINIASVLGRISVACAGPYCISKYGVEAFSDALRRQLRPFGVSVQIVEPGFFGTMIHDPDPIVRNLMAQWDSSTEEIKTEYGREYLNTVVEAVKSIPSSLPTDLEPVVNAYIQATLGRFPRARYTAGSDAHFFWIPLQILPEWISDRLFEWTYSSWPKPAVCAGH